MMSMKCKYALKALVRLGMNYGKTHLQTKEIAVGENIPEKFLVQILLELKHARLVKSRQGAGGGYSLAKKPKDISIASVYRMFDGVIALVPCAAVKFYERCSDCTSEEECDMRLEFIKIKERTRQIMNKITIQSFISAKKI